MVGVNNVQRLVSGDLSFVISSETLQADGGRGRLVSGSTSADESFLQEEVKSRNGGEGGGEGATLRRRCCCSKLPKTLLFADQTQHVGCGLRNWSWITESNLLDWIRMKELERPDIFKS